MSCASASVQDSGCSKELTAGQNAGRNCQRAASKRQSGFTLVELIIVALIILIMLGIALPSISTITQTYRLTGDARILASELNLTRMRAASRGTRTRLNVNLAANTFQLEYWNTAATPPAYQVEGGVQNLSQGNKFSFGTLTKAAGQQSTIAEGYPTETGCGCVYFNSRGLVTDANQVVNANAALYLTNGRQYAAIALSVAGQTTGYMWTGSAWNRF